ncbi:MAG: DUF4097 family beta strand repeat-containing protein [Gammaproteobacteria bacterium]
MNIMKPILILSIFLATSAMADESVNRRLDASNDDTVRIENIAGRITVEAWSRNEVQVIGTIADGVEEFIFERSSHGIEIIVKWPRGGRHHRHHIDDTDLDIKVPAGVDLEISGVSADIEITGTNGKIEAETVSGEVFVEAKSVANHLSTVSGDIELSGSAKDARIVLESVSGELVLRGVHGQVEANSISGDISLRDSRVFRMNGETISGDITIEAELEKNGVYHYEAINGDVEIITRGEPDATFDLSSFNGDIDNDYGPAPERTSKYAPGTELRFKSGNGSADVTINTLNGDIILDKR